MGPGAILRGVDDEDRRSPAEKVVAGSLIDRTGVGRPLSERTLQRQRTQLTAGQQGVLRALGVPDPPLFMTLAAPAPPA